MLINAAKLIGAGLATISILGTGIGIGLIFSAIINAYSRTPEHVKQLFTYAILGFALTEAIALFGLMMSFLILFSNVMENLNHNIITEKKMNTQQHPFHIVKPSPWPFAVAFSIYLCVNLFVLWMHHYPIKQMIWINFCKLGIPLFFFAVISWFWDIIIEATYEGKHTSYVRRGLRIGFILFIVSEIMFFFSFFWTFFYLSVSPSIWIGCVWPPLGIQPINPWGLPFVNTVILLTSGVSVTWAHKAMASPKTNTTELPYFIKVLKIHHEILGFKFNEKVFKYNARREVMKAIIITILLGVLFTYIQLYEYAHAKFSINDGVYGSIFYLLTGFHGFHVLIGTIFLFVCLIRHIFYHFTRDIHLGMEFAIWYWHFVDIIWILLYLFVYIWGGL